MALEKIEKVILSFKDFRLIHSVILGSKGKDGSRKSNIFSSTYNSNKYTDESQLSTLYINSSDYLVFRHNSTKAEVYFSYPHLASLLEKLKKIHTLLIKKSDVIFIEKENQTLLNADYKGRSRIYGAASSIVYIGFSIFEDKDDEYCGVVMYLNKQDNIINLTTDELGTLIYVIERFDLYASSLLLLTTGNIYNNEPTKSTSYGNMKKQAGKPVKINKK